MPILTANEETRQRWMGSQPLPEVGLPARPPKWFNQVLFAIGVLLLQFRQIRIRIFNMCSLQIKMLDLGQSSQQLESGPTENRQQHRHRGDIDLIQILNQTQVDNEARIRDMEIRKAKQNIESMASEAIIKSHKMREQQLLDQIQSLREDVQMMEAHFHELNTKYTQKRKEAIQFMEQAIEVNHKYDHLTQRYLLMEDKTKKRERELIENFNAQAQQHLSEHQQIQQMQALKIKQLEANNKQLLQLLKSAEKQNGRLKQMVEVEVSKRKNLQEDFRKRVEELRRQIDRLNLHLAMLGRQVEQKQNQLVQKDQNAVSMEKSMREMSQRVAKIEADTKREIMREKVKAKKALDGLQMTRKYSQLELSKSRKKEKYYMHSQKQLLEKVKQIVKDQNLIDTIEKSNQRGQSNKSLNTTLKLVKHQKQSSSPFVSYFRPDDSEMGQLSPINKVSQPKEENQWNYDSRGLSSHRNSCRSGIAKCRVEIPGGLSANVHAAGTPCFQSQGGEMFRARK